MSVTLYIGPNPEEPYRLSVGMAAGLIQVLARPNFDARRSTLVQVHDADAFCVKICSHKGGLVGNLLTLIWAPGETYVKFIQPFSYLALN